MGRAAAVTYEQVAAVADQFYRAGVKNPGASLVRGELKKLADAAGTSVGSPNTIQTHLEQWRRVQRPADAPGAPAPLPPQLAGDLARALSVAAEVARKEVQADLDQCREEVATLAAEGLRLEAANAELVEQLAAMTSQRDAMQGQLAERTAEADRLREALRVSEEQRIANERLAHAATADAQAATGRVDEIRASAGQQVQQMQATLQQANARESEARAASVAADQRAVAAEARLEGAQETAQAVKAQLADLQSQVARLQDAATRAAAAEATCAALREQVELLTSTLSTVAHLLPPGQRIEPPGGKASGR